MPSSIIRSFAEKALNSQQGRDRWRMYRALRKDHADIAATAWRGLLNDSEKASFLAQLDDSHPESVPALGFKGLTTKNLWGENAPPYIETSVLLKMAGISSNKEVFAMLPVQYRVNYHGHLCVSVRDGDGKIPAWDKKEQAFRVQERSQVTVVAFLSATTADLADTVRTEEMEISNGSDRPLVPFQVEVEGHPLRFLKRSKYDEILVPLQGQSAEMNFDIHPESLTLPPEQNRVTIWVNCRQNNSLVQCLCAPLLVVARKKRNARKQQ